MEVVYSEPQLAQVARQLMEEFPEERFFAFFGKMGAGKTTLIKAVCAYLGVADNVCSPTFAIVNEYTDREGSPVYHFDFYRLKRLEEAFDIGYEEYFYGGDYCFVEWPEKIEEILPERYVKVELEEEESGRRIKASVMEFKN